MGVGADRVGSPGWGDPGEKAGPVLFQPPLWVLFQLVVSAAPAAEIAPAGPAVLVVGAGVVEISARRAGGRPGYGRSRPGR